MTDLTNPAVQLSEAKALVATAKAPIEFSVDETRDYIFCGLARITKHRPLATYTPEQFVADCDAVIKNISALPFHQTGQAIKFLVRYAPKFTDANS